jgi:hypothetical protein
LSYNLGAYVSNLHELTVKDLPVVFLSYREPNADENFRALERLKLPNLVRVGGVKGHDAAHKAAAKAAHDLCPGVENFVTVDADAQVQSKSFWNHWLIQVQERAQVPDLTQAVVSFRAFNAVNGAMYGNGGLKIWSQDFVRNMRTHEASDGSVVDFCWDRNYVQMKNVVCTTHPNGDALQAFRSGYREGVKLLLANDLGKLNIDLIQNPLSEVACLRIHQWITLGSDAPFGVWCQSGFLEGALDVFEAREKAVQVLTDYDVFQDRFNLQIERLGPLKAEDLEERITLVWKELRYLLNLRCKPLSRSASALMRDLLLSNVNWEAPLERE